MKVTHAFKAKMETFRESFYEKVEMDLQILGRDENRFSITFVQNLVPNPDSSALSAQRRQPNTA